MDENLSVPPFCLHWALIQACNLVATIQNGQRFVDRPKSSQYAGNNLDITWSCLSVVLHEKQQSHNDVPFMPDGLELKRR